MNSLISLHAHHKPVNSPFGLLGHDENALSFAFAYTLQQCPMLLQWFLRHRDIGISGVRQSSLQNARIDLQQHGDSGQGITDIEIRLPGHFHVIVEAKVGLAVPTLKQCRKYLKRLRKSTEPKKKLVALVQSPDDFFVERYALKNPEMTEQLKCFNWSELLPECVRIMSGNSVEPEAKAWVRAFYSFLDQEYRMKTFSTEVWILSVNTEPMWTNGKNHWDIHQENRVWWSYNQHSVRPLYLAFRVGGRLDSICRVRQIEHDIPIIDRVPELAKSRNSMYKKPCTIWHFEKPVSLPNPIRTGAGMFAKRVRCDLDLLLSCKTVREIEWTMAKRRKQRGE